MAGWEALFRSESGWNPPLSLGPAGALAYAAQTDAGKGPSFKALTTQRRAKIPAYRGVRDSTEPATGHREARGMGAGQRFQQGQTTWETCTGQVLLEVPL